MWTKRTETRVAIELSLDETRKVNIFTDCIAAIAELDRTARSSIMLIGDIGENEIRVLETREEVIALMQKGHEVAMRGGSDA